MVGFYNKYCENYTHIIVEEDVEPKVLDSLDLPSHVTYIYNKSDTEWNKCKGYNTAFKIATTNTLLLNDVDIIVHPDQILQTASNLSDNDNAALMYPYNGLFLCVEKNLKELFCKDLDYDVLSSNFPEPLNDYNGVSKGQRQRYRKYINEFFNNGNVMVGHVSSMGGCVMARRDNLLKLNGYNPNFIGWGYEDDEMPVRANKLGYEVSRLGFTKAPAWHLHHYDGTGSQKETQPFYEHNRQEVSKVEHMAEEELNTYKDTWIL
jgi:predicted glycosyltransferase involved in capsule biosynthesis